MGEGDHRETTRPPRETKKQPVPAAEGCCKVSPRYRPFRVPARTRRLPFLALLAALTLGGCGRTAAPGASGPARRVVCMAPAYSEICFALGRGEAVVGVTDFCVFPPEVARAARVGGFLNPDLERIAKLRPDLVLTAPEQGQLRRNLEALGLRTRTLPVYSVADILSTVEAVGRELGAEEAARRLSADLREATAPRPLPPGARPPRALLVVGRNPGELSGIFVAGPGTFLSEVLGRAGGANVCPEGILYPTLSLEGIASLDPEVILELRPGEGLTDARKTALAGDWERMPFLKAVKARRVFILTEDWVDIPGPRVVQTLRLFRRILHP